MIKIDTSFFKDVRIRAIRTEFGAVGVLVIIELMAEMFESPNGYWREWKAVDRMAFAGDHGLEIEELDRLIERMVDYKLVSSSLLSMGILTSAFFEREFIRQCGAARYNRIRRHESCLTSDELMELGCISAVEDPDGKIPYGEPRKLSSYEYPKTHERYRIVRIRSSMKGMAVFKRVLSDSTTGMQGQKT